MGQMHGEKIDGNGKAASFFANRSNIDSTNVRALFSIGIEI
jgi:hypothetical protein